jgi:hypothetical protein
MFKTRETVERASKTYSLYFENQRGYAHFTLVPDLGIVHAQTDWGDYCHRWGNIGEETLEEFLSDIDSYYIGIKFCGRPSEIDEKTTLKDIKIDILKERRKGYLSARMARKNYDACREINFDSTASFYYTFPDKIITEIYGGDPSSVPLQMVYTGWQTVFIHDIFPAFQEYLKNRIVK